MNTRIEKIDSIKDDRIVLARALNSRQGRVRHGKMLLEGERALDAELKKVSS